MSMHLVSRFPPLNTSMKRSSGESGAPNRFTMCIGMPACTRDRALDTLQH